MADDLLNYYNRELAFLRQLGVEFSDAHPKIAGRLRLGEDTVADPHVAHLVESVAFLNARTRRKLDDSFPELTDALLGVLYPHYLAPVPSMAIIQLAPKTDLTSKLHIPAGTGVETERVHGDPCRFQTAYPLDLWPIRITRGQLMGTPFDAPQTPDSAGAVAALRLTLECLSDGTSFGDLAPTSLRFFLRGQPEEVHALYELLMNDALDVAVASSPSDKAPVILGKDSLRPVGFGPDEGLLPYSERSFPGYRLLTEFFAFPTKFLFFEVSGLPAEKLREVGSKLELFVYLRRTSSDLEQSVNLESFALGCTPIVNLFKRRAEPIRLTHTDSEYRVVPDARRPLAMEVYSIDRVRAISPQNETVEYMPFYGLDHGGKPGPDRAWWYATRRESSGAKNADDGQVDHGREVYLRLVDLDFDPRGADG